MSFLRATGSLWRQPRGRICLLLVLVVATLVGVVVAQLLYPSDRALPVAYIGNQEVGGDSYGDLVANITTSFESSQVVIASGEGSEAVPLSHLGASPDTDEMVKILTEYPLPQRLIPFSFYFVRPHLEQMHVSINPDQLNEAAKLLASKLSFAPEDAKLDLVGGDIATEPAKPGYVVSEDDLKVVVRDTAFKFGSTEVSVAGDEQTPRVTDEDINELRGQIITVANRPLVLAASDDMQFRPGPRDIASWLVVSTDDGEAAPEIKVDPAQLSGYVADVNDKIGASPGTEKVSVVDGKEVSRSQAESGLEVDRKKLIEDIEGALFDSASSGWVLVDMVPVPPKAKYERRFTSSQKGLKAYVDHVTSTEDIRIAVSQVGGKGWSAYGRADEQTVAASTYKLYVSHMLFDQVRKGKLSWGGSMLGTDTASCLERIIVVSDNPCAEEMIRIFGGTNLNNFLYSKGISRSTTFISKVASQTTARDLNKFLVGLETGSMIGGADRSNLLSKMRRQVYRQGIPAGSAGRVHDKVGFLWDYLNDAAVVYHPKGTYTLAIMTKKSSWQRIAEITKELERIMYAV